VQEPFEASPAREGIPRIGGTQERGEHRVVRALGDEAGESLADAEQRPVTAPLDDRGEQRPLRCQGHPGLAERRAEGSTARAPRPPIGRRGADRRRRRGSRTCAAIGRERALPREFVLREADEQGARELVVRDGSHGGMGGGRRRRSTRTGAPCARRFAATRAWSDMGAAAWHVKRARRVHVPHVAVAQRRTAFPSHLAYWTSCPCASWKSDSA
jgi:hypothetical protein